MARRAEMPIRAEMPANAPATRFAAYLQAVSEADQPGAKIARLPN